MEGLTETERERIYEEERARREAAADFEQKQKIERYFSWNGLGALTLSLGIIFYSFDIVTFDRSTTAIFYGLICLFGFLSYRTAKRKAQTSRDARRKLEEEQ